MTSISMFSLLESKPCVAYEFKGPPVFLSQYQYQAAVKMPFDLHNQAAFVQIGILLWGEMYDIISVISAKTNVDKKLASLLLLTCQWETIQNRNDKIDGRLNHAISIYNFFYLFLTCSKVPPSSSMELRKMMRLSGLALEALGAA